MGIIEEGQDVMKEFKGASALGAGLLAAAQAVEHYEIARYYAEEVRAELGLNQAMKLLEQRSPRKRRRTRPSRNLRKTKSTSTLRLLDRRAATTHSLRP